MTDSVAVASFTGFTDAMRPCSSRSIPTTGWSSTRTESSCAASSSMTESTRNGESGVFVSMIEPTDV